MAATPSYQTIALSPTLDTYDSLCGGNAFGGSGSCTSGDQKTGDTNSGCCNTAGCGNAGGRKSNCVRWVTNNRNSGKGYCPAIGTVTAAQWIPNSQIKCTYSDITIPLSQVTTDYFPQTTINLISEDKCGKLTAGQLLTDVGCRSYYKSGGNLNYEILKRMKDSNGQWVFYDAQRRFIQAVMKGSQEAIAGSVSGSSSIASDQAMAGECVQTLCDNYPGMSECACYNVNKFRNDCMLFANNGKPGCNSWYNSRSKLVGAGIDVSSLNATNHFCQSDACTAAITDPNVLLPAPHDPCSVNIAACITSYINNSFEGSSLTNDCRASLNVTINAPAPAPGSTPAPAPAPAPASGPSPASSPDTPAPDTPAPAPAPAPAPDNNKKNGIIIGSVIGGVVFILLIVLCLVFASSGGSSTKNVIDELRASGAI